jgi:hypothetical protein
MRFVFTTLLFGFTLLCRAQRIAEIEERLRLIEKPVELKYDTTGFSALPHFENECDDENVNKWDYYHVTDLNKDGLNDLIYSGPCMPYARTVIFINNGTSMKIVYDYAGSVTGIKQKSDRTIVDVFKKACCCDYNSDCIEVAIYNDSRVEENMISFDGNTSIRLDNPIMIKARGAIRTSPQVDNKKRKDDCTGEPVKGNYLQQINKLTDVVQLGKEKGWSLVLYEESKQYSWVGWMKVD